MFLYFVFFLISLILLWISNSVKNVFFSRVLLVLSICFPSFLAGWRDWNIGSDTVNYINYWHIACSESSFLDYFYWNRYSMEGLYLLFNFVISRFTYSDQYFLFAVQFFILMFIIAAARNSSVNVVWALFIYLTIMFNASLNIVRQIIAIVFCVMSLSHLLKGKYFVSIACLIVAYGFHHSSLIYMMVPILYFLIHRFGFMKLKIVQALIVAIIFLLFTLFAPITMSLINNFVGDEYEHFTSSDAFGQKFPIALFGLSIVNVIIYIICLPKKKDNIICLFSYLIYLSPVICLTGLISRNLARLVYYPLFSIILILPFLIKYYNVPLSMKLFIIVAYASYFILTAVPYKFIMIY